MDDTSKLCVANRYYHVDLTRRDILSVRKVYQGLNLSSDKFVFSNGMTKDLVKLDGTIPVPYRGKTYNIPVCLWLMDTHPVHPPVCLVEPTTEMCLKPSKHLDFNGRVYLPYLSNWNEKSSNLLELIKIMIDTFSGSPPVYSVSPKTDSSNSKPSYPLQPVTNRLTGTGPSSTSTTPYPPFQTVPSYPPYSTSQTNTLANFQYPGYPPYPTPATSTPLSYPAYPPSPSVSHPYPFQSTTNASVQPYPTTATSPASAVTSPRNTGTITDEHIRASLMSAIEDKIRRKINEQTALCHDEMEILLQTQRELNQGKNKLDNMFESMKKEKESIEQKIQILKNKEEELEKTIQKLSVEEDVDVDEAVITTTPLYKQILNTHCEDAATEDTIYYIGEALRRGVIDLDVFIKQVRALSRKRLMLKSLLEKCRLKAGLAV